MPEENDASQEAQANATTEVEGTEGAQEPTPFDQLKSFMDERNLKSPDDLSDFVQDLGSTEQWKKQYGDSQNQVGELRKQVEGLQAQIQQPAYPPEYGDQQPVNIRDVVGNEIRSVLGEMQKQQSEAQMKYLVERNDLMKRPGWKDVQPHFDKALTDPQVQYALQNGRLTQERLYSQINERVLMSRVNSFVQQMPEGALTAPSPNAETSDRIQQPTPELEAKKQRIEKAQENQDVDALLKEILPDDDPIVKF